MIIPAVIVLVLVLAGIAVLVTARRSSATGSLSRETRKRDAGPAESAADASATSSAADEDKGRARADETRAALESTGGLPAERQPAFVSKWEPVDEEELGLHRRQFLNRALLTAVGFSVAGFGASLLGFLWPTNTGGFGGKVNAGSLDDIMAFIHENKKPFYVPDARTYIQPYPKDAIANAKHVPAYAQVLEGMEEGVCALYQKCVHLGCRVPWCDTSQWFECPCHGSKYNRVGEKKGGPAPRGLDRFVVDVSGGNVTIDTGVVIQGPPIGTDTTKQQQEGPACV